MRLAVGLKRQILQFLVINKLCLVDEYMVQGQAVDGSLPVPTDDLTYAAVVEADTILPVLRCEDRILSLQALPWLLPDGVGHSQLQPGWQINVYCSSFPSCFSFHRNSLHSIFHPSQWYALSALPPLLTMLSVAWHCCHMM